MNSQKLFLIFSMVFLCLATIDAYSIEAPTHDCYTEAFDAGRTISSSTSYIQQSAIGSSVAPGGIAVTFVQHQSVYFNVYTDVFPPTAVTNLVATSRSDGNVDLAWVKATDEESGVWGYRVYRYYFYGPEKYATCVNDGSINTPTAYKDQSDLLYGFQYIYEVRAVDYALNEQSTGNNQQIIQVVKQAKSITDLKAAAYPGGHIKLTWSAISGATYYRVYRSQIYGQRGSVINVGTNVVQPSYMDDKSTLSAGRRYFYVAQAVVVSSECTKGNNQASAISDQGGPNAPIIKSKTHPIQGQPYPDPNPVFQWVRPADPGVNQDLSGYYVKLGDSGTTGTAITEAGWEFINEVQKQYSTIANGTWFFHCRGQDSSGNLGAEAVYCAAILASGEITGRVTEAKTGNGLLGVIQAWQNGKKQAEGSTANDGVYHLTNLPFGKYKIKFNRFGYMPESVETNLTFVNTPLALDISSSSSAVIGTQEAAAYPSPATGSEVRMVYYCDEASEVVIEIYNVAAEKVAEIKDSKAMGYQYSIWPISSVSRGVYLFRAIIRGASGQTKVTPTKKFAVLK